MKTEIIIVTLIILITLGMLTFGIIYPYATHDTVQFTVTDKERITTGKTSKYLIFTSGEEVFENTDSLMYLKYNSSDIYGQLKIRGSYEAEVYGWRVYWCSWYRNIISIKKVKE